MEGEVDVRLDKRWRVSEWLAGTLELCCRVTGCGFESHALRSLFFLTLIERTHYLPGTLFQFLTHRCVRLTWGILFYLLRRHRAAIVA